MEQKSELLLKELYEASSDLIYELSAWFEGDGRNIKFPDTLQKAYIKVNNLTDNIGEYYDGNFNKTK